MFRWIRKFKVTILVLLAAVCFFFWWNGNRGYDDTAMAGFPDLSGVDESSVLEEGGSKLEASYSAYYRDLSAEGSKDTAGYSFKLDGLAYAAVSDEGTSKEEGLGGRSGGALALVDENSWVEYEFEVPQDGFYQFGMDYYAMPGKRSSLVRSVEIDGAYPFYQSKKLELQRMWKEAGETWFDNQNNEFNPKREEVTGWQYREFRDSEAKSYDPFRYYLKQGKHTIRIGNIREPGAIGAVYIFSPKQVPAYETVQQQYEEQGYKATSGHYIKAQAELSSLRSDPTLKRIEDREPDTEPFNKDAVVLNSFGGASWRTGGQWAQWEVEVPEDGLYEIGARFGQWFLNGIPVQRSVTIDGELPFEEMKGVFFPYKAEWQIAKFGAMDESDPYLYYLTKGKHTIRMEVQVGAVGPLLDQVTDTVRKMSLIGREVIQVTGTNPDPNGDWKLEQNINNLVPRLQAMAKHFDDVIHGLYDIGVTEGSSEVSTLYEVRDVLLGMAEDTQSIPARMQQFTDLQSSIGTWVSGMTKQSLLLDYLIVKSPDQPWPRASAGAFVRTGTMLYDFVNSFTKDYSGVGNIYKDEKVLDVWIARGRDWVDIIKQMVDEDFTQQTGIKVNVNVIPANQMQVLLLANTAGIAPDVALGVEGEVPIDYAVRNGLVNLKDYADYDEVASRFRPGALIPYQYDGGSYALPENQNFNMLFYRKDIMQQLGIKEEDIPDTWEEVMDLIPLLQQNGMDFYYPHAPLNPALAINEYAPFLFQNGGEFYKENGALSNLDSPEAMNAFKMWTGLFTNYKIQKQADFYNRFRSGEMPIGVADYTTYVLLSTAAPELTGWWAMKPMPGMKQADGQINRSTGGLAQTGMIFKSTDMKEEAWEFLKWWTSADTQVQFGSELESLLGVEARWNTANIEALKQMPWSESDIDAIMEQWEWFKEREVVIGGYYTTRHIANIWNEVVLNGKIPREAVEDGVKEINKELRKKREEFGLDEADGEKATAAAAGTTAEGGESP
ncbi:ABC-type glycerol-3-phosphate transport system substrate-binding protein [Paenibacillus phyllosphaerae]|uniref:ABC-type glycerol-3-phosphate transport system substrate-binding protein n=1 Tax=Paenibacillus phyllosphaerae TaxID=274593 RepID=A0A7W5AUB0_9BACL|nr:ABC-type glycerol-3-phosphate transport system substrate-binding protein [Paenibacillus phyllosphaerae]